MSARVWLLALATFVTGLAENITVGILPALAEGRQTPLGVAGQFTTVFSLSFATAAPLASRFASRWELRRLLCAALGFFIACNLAAALANGYELLLASLMGWHGVLASLAVLAGVVPTLAHLALPLFHGSERIATAAYLRHLRDGRLASAPAVCAASACRSNSCKACSFSSQAASKYSLSALTALEKGVVMGSRRSMTV